MLGFCGERTGCPGTFAGGHVPLVKNASDWQLSLSNLSHILDHLDTSRKDSKGGMSYEDYLRVLLIAKGKQEKVIRGMDMIECSIREKGKDRDFGWITVLLPWKLCRCKSK